MNPGAHTAFDTALPRSVDSAQAGNTLVRHFEQPIAHRLDLHDESLRDGEQTVGLAFPLERRIEIVQGLLGAGVRHMSLGYPAVSEPERDAIRALAKLGDPAGFSCLSRATREDIRAVVDCQIPNVALFIAISEVHLTHKLRLSQEQAHAQMVDQIRLARSYGLNVRFALEDATRAPLERIRRFSSSALSAGASLVTIPDTCGVLTPITAYRLFSDLSRTLGPDRLVAHLHNDLGMATANSLAACAAGARFVQGTLCGIGERAGNANLEQLAVALTVKYGVDLGVDLARLTALSTRMAEWVHFPVPPNQPISGEYSFCHESGVHVHGLLREAACYEPFPPSLVGRGHELRFGKHSGLSSLRYLAQHIGLTSTDDSLAAALATVKAVAERGRAPDAGEVEVILREAMHAHPMRRESEHERTTRS